MTCTGGTRPPVDGRGCARGGRRRPRATSGQVRGRVARRTGDLAAMTERLRRGEGARRGCAAPAQGPTGTRTCSLGSELVTALAAECGRTGPAGHCRRGQHSAGPYRWLGSAPGSVSGLRDKAERDRPVCAQTLDTAVGGGGHSTAGIVNKETERLITHR